MIESDDACGIDKNNVALLARKPPSPWRRRAISNSNRYDACDPALAQSGIKRRQRRA